MKIEVWILTSDTCHNGTQCDVYGTLEELNDTLMFIMEDDAKEDKKLKELIDSGDIDCAWDYWEDHHRCYLDTYSAESREIEVAMPDRDELVKALQ
jgi:hypothetical protein